jgi:hypothetical protein
MVDGIIATETQDNGINARSQLTQLELKVSHGTTVLGQELHGPRASQGTLQQIRGIWLRPLVSE